MDKKRGMDEAHTTLPLRITALREYLNHQPRPGRVLALLFEIPLAPPSGHRSGRPCWLDWHAIAGDPPSTIALPGNVGAQLVGGNNGPARGLDRRGVVPHSPWRRTGIAPHTPHLVDELLADAAGRGDAGNSGSVVLQLAGGRDGQVKGCVHVGAQSVTDSFGLSTTDSFGLLPVG